MIAPSRRFLPHLCFVLLPALVAIGAHRYVGLEHDDCAEPAKMMKSGESRRLGTLHEVFVTFQASEGELPDAQGRFSILRSYDAKRLYHHPELFFARGFAIDRVAVEWVTDKSEKVPIHRVYFENGTPRFAAYILIYDSRPVVNPYYAQLEALPRQLLNGTRPMTLAFVSAEGLIDKTQTPEAYVRNWLVGFWQKYKSACEG